MIIQIFQFYLGAISNCDIILHLKFLLKAFLLRSHLLANPKTLLHEYFQRHQHIIPTYKTTLAGGTEHAPIYESEMALLMDRYLSEVVRVKKQRIMLPV